MAEIQTNTPSKKKGNAKSKKLSTRIDLTPMVDLGFLLITFFIFTTTLANPTAMKLVMPDDASTNAPMNTSAEKTLTILVAKNNQLFYYFGLFNGQVREIGFKELRNIIMEKKQQLLKRFGSSKMVVLIKLTNEANYKNIVDSLDEMVINQVSTYMLLDIEEKELKAIK